MHHDAQPVCNWCNQHYHKLELMTTPSFRAAGPMQGGCTLWGVRRGAVRALARLSAGGACVHFQAGADLRSCAHRPGSHTPTNAAARRSPAPPGRNPPRAACRSGWAAACTCRAAAAPLACGGSAPQPRLRQKALTVAAGSMRCSGGGGVPGASPLKAAVERVGPWHAGAVTCRRCCVQAPRGGRVGRQRLARHACMAAAVVGTAVRAPPGRTCVAAAAAGACAHTRVQHDISM